MTPAEQPRLSQAGAVAWSFAVTLGWLFAVLVLVGVAPNAQYDLVMLGGTQITVYLLASALFASRRPDRGFAELFALRRTSLPLCLCALALGVALSAPADALAGLLDRFFPMPKELVEEQLARLKPRNIPHGIALGIIVVAAGPFVEELFYRGALYTGLRAEGSAFRAAGTTSLLFTLSHPEPRAWLPILALSAVLAWLRVLGGSLWPPLLLHAGFNGTALAMSFAASGERASAAPLELVLGGSAAAGVLGLLAYFFGRRSSSARVARELDAVEPVREGALP